MHNDEFDKEIDWQAFAPPPEVLDFGSGQAQEENFLFGSDEPQEESFRFGSGELWEEPAALLHNDVEQGNDDLPQLQLNAKQQKKLKRRRRRKIVRRVLLWLLIAVFLLAGTLAVLGFVAASRMNTATMEPAHAAIAHRPASNAWVTTILVIGVDDGNRADALMLVSVDHRTRTLRLTSIARDTLVRYPGADFRRINEVTVGRHGSGSRAARVVAENFNIRVDHYLLLDFNSFADIIDALGGVAVRMSPREINYITSRTWLRAHLNANELHRQMEQDGQVWLTGQQALMFTRIRTLDDDFARGGRQRMVINAMLRRVRQNPLLLVPLMTNALPGVHTSFSQLQVAGLTLAAPVMATYRVVEHRLPAVGTFRNETRNGQFVFVPNYAENSRLLREFIYGQ